LRFAARSAGKHALRDQGLGGVADSIFQLAVVAAEATGRVGLFHGVIDRLRDRAEAGLREGSTGQGKQGAGGEGEGTVHGLS
jgi:hypothetical protein